MTRTRNALTGILALGLAGLLLGTTGTFAQWTDQATIKSSDSAFTAGAVAAPRVASAVQTPTGNKVTLVWDETPVGNHGAKATAYEIYRFPAATGGTGTLVCGPVSATSCTDTNSHTTTQHYGVRAMFAENWSRDSVTRVAFVPDVEAPNVTIKAPTNDYTVLFVIPHIANNCGSSPAVIACGTISEGTAKVTYQLRRVHVVTFLGVPIRTEYYCWNGSGYTEVGASATCQSIDAAVNGQTWQALGDGYDAYLIVQSRNSYELRVTARDEFSNERTTVHRLSN